MFRESWDQRIIAGGQFLALLPALGHHGAVARKREDHGVLVAVVVHRRRRVRLCDHARRAQSVAGVDQSVLADHSLRLPAGFLQCIGAGDEDGFLFVWHGWRLDWSFDKWMLSIF